MASKWKTTERSRLLATRERWESVLNTNHDNELITEKANIMIGVINNLLLKNQQG